MSINHINRIYDEDIIDILKSVLDNGSFVAETHFEHVLIKLMQIRKKPIKSLSFNQDTVDSHFKTWLGND